MARKGLLVGFAVALLAVAAALPCAAQAKKLIEYGWDVPYPDYVRQNIRSMEERPFEGLIFRVNRYNMAFDPTRWSEADLRPQLDDLAAIHWRRFTDNFLCLYAANDAGMSWSDDAQWDAIEANMRLTSKAARIGRCIGVCFDAEPYGANPWTYDAASGRSFAEVAEKVRERGRQFTYALQAELPKARIFLLFHAAFLSSALGPDGQLVEASLAAHPYGLYPAFVAGMLDAIGPGGQVIDGNEMAYYYETAEAFGDAAKLIRGKARNLVPSDCRGRYDRHMRVGMAIYYDQVFATREPKGQYLSDYMSDAGRRRRMEFNVYESMTSSDEYTWFYSERMDWWKGNYPPDLDATVRRAKAWVAAGKPLPFDFAPIRAAAETARRNALLANMVTRTADIPHLAAGVKAPAIDGVLDDAAWAGAPELEAFLLPATQPAPGTPHAAAVAKVAWDDRALYIALRCTEPDPGAMQVATGSRDAPIWVGETAEAFVSTGVAQEPYRHFIVNPANVEWDGASGSSGDDASWDAPWISGARVGDGEWTAELAIPWSALGGAPKAGETRRANLCRQRTAEHELSSWSTVTAFFVEPDCFGTWRFEGS
jgi:hypothetical protein